LILKVFEFKLFFRFFLKASNVQRWVSLNSFKLVVKFFGSVFALLRLDTCGSAAPGKFAKFAVSRHFISAEFNEDGSPKNDAWWTKKSWLHYAAAS
jgi:hypothetical protein